MSAGTVVLVGCGQMGSAMLRGWMVRDAAARFIAIEPAGLPSSFADAKSIAWHAAAEELPDDLTPDAVVFAVKPQIINDVLPAYRRWVQPQTLFLSIAAGVRRSRRSSPAGALPAVRRRRKYWPIAGMRRTAETAMFDKRCVPRGPRNRFSASIGKTFR